MPPTAEPGGCRPDAVEAIRKRRRSLGPPSRSTATAGGSVRPARGDRSARSVLIRKTPRLAAGLKGYEMSSHSGKITPDSESPLALTSSPDEALCRNAARRFSRPYCNGLPGPISSPRGETHFRKRSRLSGRGASLAAACAAPDGLRSYRPIGPTLLTGSPPLLFSPHGANRCGPGRGSPFRLQLLRSVAPLSQQHD